MTRFLSAMHSCSWVRPWRDPGLFLPYPASSALCDAPFRAAAGLWKIMSIFTWRRVGNFWRKSPVNTIFSDCRRCSTPDTACNSWHWSSLSVSGKVGAPTLGVVRNAPGRKPMQGGPGANGPRPAEKSAGDSEKGARRHGNVTGTPVQNALYLGD